MAWPNGRRRTGTRIPDLRDAIPYIQESVFLHHPGLRCQLPQPSRLDLLGLDNHEQQIGLPGISTRLLEPSAPNQSVSPQRAEIIARVVERIGVRRRQREAGSWIIDDDPLGEGDDWQDWPAFHRVATTKPGSHPVPGDLTRRSGGQASREPADRRARVPGHLPVRPREPAAPNRPSRERPRHRPGLPARRAVPASRPLASRPAGRHRDHRSARHHPSGGRRAALCALEPGGAPLPVPARGLGAATRRRPGDPRDRRRLADGGLDPGHRPDRQLSGGVTGLFGTTDGQARTPGATVVVRPIPADADLRLTEAFQAPEQIFTDKADRIRLDVFALGALSYYILTGRPPAANRAALRERLHREDGLDLAADLPQATPGLRKLILDATRPAVSRRFADIRAFLAQLDEAERILLAPEDEETPDILDAAPGSLIDHRYRLERRLGSGSTAVGLLVTDEDENTEGPDRRRVLKVALDDAAAARLEREAEVLADLDDPHIVRLLDGPRRIGGRLALVLQQAGEQTLAEVLRGRDRLSLDMQERYGTDLLEALVVLDRAGIDHRDIKPSNLGVREDRTHRAKHLVLFDFSLSRADATAVTAGTQHYLDPFLDDPGRGRFDSAAERYSAAVVLFEMATGSVPRFGDGLSDPASLKDEATDRAGDVRPGRRWPVHRVLPQGAGEEDAAAVRHRRRHAVGLAGRVRAGVEVGAGRR